MKKAIDTKLDLIKQEISREISQHYNRKMSGQVGMRNNYNNEHFVRRNELSNENRSRKGSKSRAKSERNQLSASNSTSRIMAPYNKGFDQTLANSKRAGE